MPEHTFTPSKHGQVAPAMSGNTTPNARRNADTTTEKITNLKGDKLTSSGLFPSLEGYAAQVEAEHEDHELGKAEKAKILAEERAAIPKPTGVWAEHAPEDLEPQSLKDPKTGEVIESRRNLKPDILADSNAFPRLEKTQPVERDTRVVEEKPAALFGNKHYASEEPVQNAWKGKLPEAVKQPGEFTQAETVYVDEPAERAAGVARYKQQRKEKRQALKTGPLRWFKGEPRETWIEKRFVSGASTFLGVGIGLVCGFLRVFGLRDLSGRLVMGIRNFSDRIVEGTFLRHFRNFGHQWWMYRLVVRVIRNIDRNVREHIGPEPGKHVEDAVHGMRKESKESWDTAKREARALRDETSEVINEARNRVRKNVDELKKSYE